MEELPGNITRINFKAFFRLLWKEKFLITFIIAIFTGLGLWYAFTQREEFTSEGKILPELPGKANKLGNLAGLASLAGLDLSNIESTEAIRPDLYPDVLKSTPFFLELFNQIVFTKENKKILFEQFYHNVIEEGNTIEQKDMKKFPVAENGFIILNRLNENRIKDLKRRIVVGIDKKSGIISISVKMPDPIVAAQIARFSMIYLTEYVTKYRIDKAKQDRDFLEEKVNAAKGKFYSNQTKRAQYNDQFQLPTIRMQSADIQRERIESEYKMSVTFYNELVKKYEEARIKVQQETPVFQVLEPPTAPTQKSEPMKSLILLIFLFFGGLISLLTILVKGQNYKSIIVN